MKSRKEHRIMYWLEYGVDSENYLFRSKKGKIRRSIKRFKTFKKLLAYVRNCSNETFKVTRLKINHKGRWIRKIWDVIV